MTESSNPSSSSAFDRTTTSGPWGLSSSFSVSSVVGGSRLGFQLRRNYQEILSCQKVFASQDASISVSRVPSGLVDEVAGEHYQRFKREIVSELSEEEWTLTRRDLDAWCEEVTSDA